MGNFALEDLKVFLRNRAQGQNRTADTRIFSPLLYRLSYLGVSLSREGKLHKLNSAVQCLSPLKNLKDIRSSNQYSTV